MPILSRPALRSYALATLLLLPLGACTCATDGEVVSSGGRILFEPETADFGYVIVGQSAELKIAVRNTGRGTLKIRSIDRADGFPDKITYSPPRMQLEPGEVQELRLFFNPDTDGVREGKLLLRNDGVEDPVELAVRGVGIYTHLVMEPPTVDFGSVIVDDAGERTATLQNQGDTPVDVFVDPALTGDNPDSFRVVLPGQDQRHRTLAAGEKLDLALSFQPHAPGPMNAKFSVRPCAGCNPTDLLLVGKGIAAGIVTEPEELDFGAVLPNTKATKALLFRNVGNKKIAITGIRPAQAATEFGVVAPAAWPVFEPGATATIDFTYQPGGLGSDSTEFTVETDDARAPRFQVRVLGYGGGPKIDVTPGALEFNTAAIGFPVKRRLTITNKGINDPNSTADNLVIDAIDPLVGDFAYTISNGGTLPLSIAPGSREVIEVTYGPTDVGEDRATIKLHSNDADRAIVDVPLHGAGQFLPPCDYELLPAANPGLNFGVVQRGRSSSLSFTLKNIGSSKCVIGAMDIDASGAGVFVLPAGGVFGKLLDVGERLLTEVQFSPPGNATSGTNYASTVNLTISSTTAPEQRLQLTGRGAEVCLSITPTGVDFGVVEPNCETNDRTFTVYNACSTPVRIDNIITGQSQSEFRVLKPTLPATLQPRDSLRFNARYRPVDLGTDTGTIEVYTNQSITGNPPQPYVLTLQGKGETDARATETFVQAERAQADILFVVDDSGSMSEEQQTLSQNFASFMNFAIAQQVDYRLAVTSTGTLASSSCGSNAADGKFLPLSGAGRIVTNALPNPGAQFAQNVNLGTNGCATEMPLEAAYRALSDPNINGSNAGFLRPDAYLSVILVSDEEDQSPQPVDFYVNFFQNIKGPRGANLVSVSTITGLNAPDGCTGPGGDSEWGSRCIAVSQRTGGLSADICSANWAAELQKLGLIAFGYKSRFILNSEPDPATLRVKIDGNEVPAGPLWSYTAATNSIDFLPTAVPPAGSTIEISYAVACH